MKRRSNGEGSFYQSNGYYCWRIAVNGKAIVRKAKTQKDLKLKVKEVQMSLSVDASGDGLRATPFSVAIRRYASEVYGDPKDPSSIKGAHGTAVTNWGMVEDTIAIIGKLPVSLFETKHVRQIASAMKSTPAKAKRCIQHALAALPAQRRMLIREKLKDERFTMPKTRGAKERVLSNNESKLLRHHLINTETHANRWLYLFLLNTGCRIGEALAISEKSIDMANATVTIDAHVIDELEQIGNRVRRVRRVANSTKNKKSRTIHLNLDAMLAIEEALRVNARNKLAAGSLYQGNLLFGNEVGGPLAYGATNVVLKRICKSIGINDISQHVLRATYATNLAMILPPGKAPLGAAILGNSPEVFAKHYNRMSGLQGTEFAQGLTIGAEN
jgi:integrase